MTATAKNVRLNIGVTTPPMLGDFTTITKKPKRKTLSLPKKLLQIIFMDIRLGDGIALGVHNYILTIFERDMRYVWAYGMNTLFRFNVIHTLQEFILDARQIPYMFYTDFDWRTV